jgi:hypothetical protein
MKKNNKNFLQELSSDFKETNTLPILYSLLKETPLHDLKEKQVVVLEAESKFYKSNKFSCEKFYKPISKIY